MTSLALAQRAVLGELNVGRALSASSPPFSCKSPQSGTVAVGVGVSPRASLEDKENVPPMYDSSLHQPAIQHDDDGSDSDEEDPLAALDRMRREREGAAAVDEKHDEQSTSCPPLDEGDEYDPFTAPSKLTVQRQRVAAALARLAAEDEEEEHEEKTTPVTRSFCTSPSRLRPSTASPPSAQSTPFQPTTVAPSLPSTLASFPYGPTRPSPLPSSAIRPSVSPTTAATTSFKPPPVPSFATSSPVQMESVSADVDMGASRVAMTSRKATVKRASKDIAGFFVNRNTPPSSSAGAATATATPSPTASWFSRTSQPAGPTTSISSAAASHVPAATMPYGPPPPAASKQPSTPLPPPIPSTTTLAIPPPEAVHTATVHKAANDEPAEAKHAKAAEESKKRSRDEEEDARLDRAGPSKARKDGEETSPRKAIELFTTNEDEDDDDDQPPRSTTAAIDIEAQLMDEDDEAADDKQEDQEEVSGTAEAGVKQPNVGGAESEHAAAVGGEGEGQDGDGEGAEEGEEGEVDIEEDEEQLAVELLAEDEEEDDEEHRRAARIQLAALNDNSDQAAARTAVEDEAEEDSDASHSSDEDDEVEEDWVALQAEDDKQRRARLDQLHSQTEHVIRRAAAQPFELPHSLLDNRGEAVNARYAKLLEKVRDREKAVGGVVRYIGETEEEERRRKRRQEREKRDEEDAGEGTGRPAVQEREVDGEVVLEIDVEELENEEVEDEEEDDEGDDEQEETEERNDEPQAEQTSEESAASGPAVEKHANGPSPTAAALSSTASADATLNHTTTAPSTRPLSEIVAEQSHRAAVSPPTAAASSDESTQSESDKPPSSTVEKVELEQAEKKAAESDDDLIDDEMDDEMKQMIRKAQATRKRKREQQAALAAQQQQQQAGADSSSTMQSDAPTPVASLEAVSCAAELASITHSKTIALPSAFSELMERGRATEQQQRQCDGEERERSKRRKSESMVEDEAEDDDLAEGRRSRDADDEEEGSDNSKNEYEEDGFMVRDADVEPTDDTTRQVHANADREKDEREVAALASRFVPALQTATRTPSTTAAGTVTKTASNSLTRKGSNASSNSSSPSKRSPSPSSLPTPPSRSMSIVAGSLLDEDRANSSDEEEEVDENSTARKNKRATLQFRTRMLRKPASLLTAPASTSSPNSSPIKSLSGFELLEEVTLSSAAVMAAPSPPLAAPVRRGSVVKEKANDFTALHAEITRQRSLIRHNSFLLERTSSLVGSAATTTASTAGGGVVSVKSVSLSKSYIFRRVADENNENTAHKRSSSPSAAQPTATVEKAAAKVNRAGKGREAEVAKCAVAGSVVLAQLQRSKTLSPALLAARMGRRPSGSMLVAFAKPTTIRAVSDR